MSAEVLDTILAAVIPALAILFAWCVKLFTEFVRAKATELKTKTDNENIKTYIDIVSGNAVNVVQSLNQTLVNELKSASEDGKLTTDDIICIKNKAVNMLSDTLSEDIKSLLETTFGDTESYLSNIIEKTLCDVKNNAKG